ncbi:MULTISPECIES: hypothetical protein [unclassified Variovorax]|uniref:hypothetical protein n=1 Tax=Variovorax atrisoli TaxID=3394203 RepID=UPI003398EAD9
MSKAFQTTSFSQILPERRTTGRGRYRLLLPGLDLDPLRGTSAYTTIITPIAVASHAPRPWSSVSNITAPSSMFGIVDFALVALVGAMCKPCCATAISAKPRKKNTERIAFEPAW